MALPEKPDLGSARTGRRKLWVLLGVALVVGVLVGSVLTTSLVSMQHQLPSGQSPTKDGIVIAGTETVKVLGPSGQVILTWVGPDPIAEVTFNDIAACITGSTTQPPGFIACSNWIGTVQLDTDSPSGTCTYDSVTGFPSETCSVFTSPPVTNVFTPVGCSIADINCSGWITEATFGPSTFTSSNCGTSCNVEAVVTYIDCFATATYGLLACGSLPSIATVSPGDTLTINIQFAVS